MDSHKKTKSTGENPVNKKTSSATIPKNREKNNKKSKK